MGIYLGRTIGHCCLYWNGNKVILITENPFSYWIFCFNEIFDWKKKWLQFIFRHAALHCQGYVALLGSDDQSWGWNLVDNQLIHNGAQISPYPRINNPPKYQVNYIPIFYIIFILKLYFFQFLWKTCFSIEKFE